MTLNPYDIVLHPWVTEKTMNRLDHENKIDFVVQRTATKPKVKWAVEKLFETQVATVRTRITMHGEKIATVRFADDVKAEDIAMRVGIF